MYTIYLVEDDMNRMELVVFYNYIAGATRSMIVFQVMECC